MSQTQAFHVQHYRRKAGLLARIMSEPGSFDGKWDYRWRAVSDRNGRVLASGQGYSRITDLKDTCRLLFGADVRFQEVDR